MMKDIRFEWDADKNLLNKRKHDVSFEEAQTVFYDSAGRILHDEVHSEEEDRFVLLGMSYELRLLVVCHVYRDEDEVIRIISARKATRNEQFYYGRAL